MSMRRLTTRASSRVTTYFAKSGGTRPIGNPIFIMGLLLALLFFGCGSDSIKPAGSDDTPGESQGVLTGLSDQSGIARITNQSGVVVMEAELRSPNGEALAGYPVTLMMSDEVVLIAFQTPDTGLSCGTLLLNTTVSTNSTKPGTTSHNIRTGTFIIDRDNPGDARLYDATRDPNPSQVVSFVTGAQLIPDPDRLLEILQEMPGLQDSGNYTLRDLVHNGLSDDSEVLYVMPPAASFPDSGGPILFVRTRFGNLSSSMPSEFPFHVFELDKGACPFLLIPGELDVSLEWDSPVAGESFAGSEESILELAGRLSIPQSLLDDPGLKIEWMLDGFRDPESCDLKMEISGCEKPFCFSKNVALTPGTHQVDLFVILSPRIRGLRTPVSGEVVHMRRSFIYEPDRSNSRAPTLTQFSYPHQAYAPQASFYLSFLFQDSDGDVTTAHERVRWLLNGEAGSWSGSARVTDQADLSGFTGTESRIYLPLTYYGAIPGDWIEWSFWVEDAAGHASHPLNARVDIISAGSSTGFSTGFSAGSSTGFFVESSAGSPVESSSGSFIECAIESPLQRAPRPNR